MSFALIVIVCGFYSSTFLIQTIGARENMRSELYEKWYGEYPAWYHILEAGEWFNENDNDAKIAYTGFNFHYHLYGRELNREVDYVNVNECAKCVYKDYAAEDASIRRDANFDNWMRNLHAMDKEYLVVEPQIAGILNNEFEWVKEHPYNFQEVFRAGETYIYKIKYE